MYLFLQESHSSIEDETERQDEFKGPFSFFYDETDFYNLAKGFRGSKTFELIREKKVSAGEKIPLLTVNIYGAIYLLFFTTQIMILSNFAVGIYLFKVSNGNTRTICENWSKLTITTQE